MVLYFFVFSVCSFFCLSICVRCCCCCCCCCRASLISAIYERNIFIICPCNVRAYFSLDLNIIYENGQAPTLTTLSLIITIYILRNALLLFNHKNGFGIKPWNESTMIYRLTCFYLLLDGANYIRDRHVILEFNIKLCTMYVRRSLKQNQFYFYFTALLHILLIGSFRSKKTDLLKQF